MGDLPKCSCWSLRPTKKKQWKKWRKTTKFLSLFRPLWHRVQDDEISKKDLNFSASNLKSISEGLKLISVLCFGSMSSNLLQIEKINLFFFFYPQMRTPNMFILYYSLIECFTKTKLWYVLILWFASRFAS